MQQRIRRSQWLNLVCKVCFVEDGINGTLNLKEEKDMKWIVGIGCMAVLALIAVAGIAITTVGKYQTD